MSARSRSVRMAPSRSEPSTRPPRRPPLLPSLPSKGQTFLDPLLMSPDFVILRPEDRHSPPNLTS